MNRFAFLSAIALLMTVAQAQDALRKPVPPPQPLGPQLVINEAQKQTPLAITLADIRVAIVGDLAETTMTLTFANPNDRVLEGELRFPLPEGATVSGYGLDVNGEMVDGVPVEKHQARVIFETEVRKGVDPGLMEHVAGNNFRTRVYPIPARGQRTVKVQYVSDLIATSDGLNYFLPLKWDQVVARFNLNVGIANPPAPPIFRGLPVQNEPNQPATSDQPSPTASTFYSRSYNNIRFNDDLAIAIPAAPPQRVSVAKRTQPDGQPAHYFLISDLCQVRLEPLARTVPRHIALLWDCSLSRSTTNLARELSLIEILARTAKRTQIDVIRFSDRPQACKTFTIDDQGNAAELIDYLKSTAYDGGTDLSSLRLPDGIDYAILCTDGLSNLGPIPDKFAAPVYVVTGDSRANHTGLQAIALRSGGAYLNLGRYENEAAAGMIGATPLALTSVEVMDGKVAELTPSHSQIATGRVYVAGQLLSESATVRLTYGLGRQVVAASIIQLKQSDAVEGRLIPRAWAQRRIAELSRDEVKNHNAILALGREFSIVTPNTSLLVLETLQQYIDHKITPPRSRADMYAAYVKHVEAFARDEERWRVAKIDNVLAQWNARVAWWNQRVQFWEQQEEPLKDAKDNTETQTPRDTRGMEPLPIRIPKPAYSGTPKSLPPGMVGTSPSERAMARQYPDLLEFDSSAAGGKPDKKADNSGIATASIQIAPWDPETPYLTKLRLARPEDAYNVYLNERKTGASPAFYLDCANFFIQRSQREIGIRILTNIAELELDAPALLRVAAYRLVQISEHDLAIILFEKVLSLRPDEPQSHRDLALALIARAEKQGRDRSPNGPLHAGNGVVGETTLPANDCARALSLLHHVVMHDWNRFPGIEVIALMEANRLMARMDAMTQTRELAFPFDKRLIKLLDCGIRVVLTWDTDDTDMDLWVTDPLGEKCFFSHARTTLGGMISRDFTQGYGPEEFCLRKTLKGQYKIQANYYGSRQQSLSGPTTLQAEVITNFGRPNEKRQAITLRLESARQVVDVGTVTVE